MQPTQIATVVNILLSIGSIIGISLFTSQEHDVFKITDTFNFYWFVSVFSFLFGILGFMYHHFSFVKERVPKSDYNIYYISLLSFIMAIFWLAASISMASLLKNCLYIKNLETNFNSEFVQEYNYTCNGEIVSVSFGFSLFVLWFLVTFILLNSVYNRLLVTPYEDIEMPEQQMNTAVLPFTQHTN